MSAKSREEKREERRKFHADVHYNVWWGGGDPDAVDYDRVEDCRYGGAYPSECADKILSEQRRERWRERERREQEEYERAELEAMEYEQRRDSQREQEAPDDRP